MELRRPLSSRRERVGSMNRADLPVLELPGIGMYGVAVWRCFLCTPLSASRIEEITPMKGPITRRGRARAWRLRVAQNLLKRLPVHPVLLGNVDRLPALSK